MPEPGDESSAATPIRAVRERADGVVTLLAVLWVAAVAVAFSLTGGNLSLVGLLAMAPFIAASFARPSRVALVGVLAAVVSVVVPVANHAYGGLNHTLRVVTTLAATALAMWISQLRVERTVQLRTARWETRNERRRRVAAEMAQRLQAMARALNTAVDPVQVADAVFTALRDELQVDAATFALVDERGRLQTLRRFGYDAGDPVDGVLDALRPGGPVLEGNNPLFAESRKELRRQRPDVDAALGESRFRALAVVPLVVSDHTIGAVVARWAGNRELSEPDRGFLFAITGAAAQAVERARLTVIEFVNLERGEQLHHLSSALAVATTPRDVANAAVTAGLETLGARAAVVRVPVPGTRMLSCLAGSGQAALLTRTRVPLEWTDAGTCFVEGRATVTTVTPADEAAAENVELVPGVVEEMATAVTIVNEPLVGSVGPLGVLSMAFVDRPEPGQLDLRFLANLAGLTTQAFERAQVFEHERAARRDAEAGRERLSLLSEVTRLLSSSLDPTMVIGRTMNLVEGRLAEACVVHVPGDGGLVRLDVRRPTTGPRGADWSGPAEIPFDSSSPAAVAFRTGRTQLAHVEPGDTLNPLEPIELLDPLDPLERSGYEEDAARALAVPLMTSSEVIGVMTFVHRPGRDFKVDDVSLATEVASRTGVALSNAARFQREHVVAEVLQRAVLPESLPHVAGLRLDAEYRAGVAGTYAGGDWYDVFELGDDVVFFSVGDVMGKGAPAAALMGQVRSAIRAYAVAGLSPTQVLSSLDRLFDTLIEDRVVTAVVGTVEPSTGRVLLANAGHPPPLVVRADGSTAFYPIEHSLLIAAGLGAGPRPMAQVFLEPGDTLVMYSDGLIERHGEAITDGMDRLAAAATGLAEQAWPEHPAEAFASLLDDEERTDDVVVLCLRYAGVPDGRIPAAPLGTRRDGMPTLHLEPVVESTPAARHWIAAHLRDLSPGVVDCAALLTSELVTNAVLHAATPITLTLHVLPDRIRVDVADASPTLPAVKDYGPDAVTGRGLSLFDTLASNWGVQPVEGGKVVWFELPVDFAVAPWDVSDGSFRFERVGAVRAPDHLGDPSPTVSVQLLGVPVAVLQKSREEYEALFRELRLMKERADASPGSPTLPERLSVLVSEIGTRFDNLGPGMDKAWQNAVDAGVEVFDWTLELPRTAVVACEFYDALLDEADEFGLAQRLLTLPASPPSVAVRRWFLSELVGQLHGKAPVTWADSRFAQGLPAALSG